MVLVYNWMLRHWLGHPGPRCSVTRACIIILYNRLYALCFSVQYSRSRTSGHYLWRLWVWATYQLRPLCMVAFLCVGGSSGWLDLNSVQIRHFANRAVKQTSGNEISKFKYDVAPRTLYTFRNFRNCTPILEVGMTSHAQICHIVLGCLASGISATENLRQRSEVRCHVCLANKRFLP